MPRTTLTQYFNDYSQAHQTRGNQITHLFGIPLIIIGLFGLLSHLHYQTELLSGLPLVRIDASLILIGFSALAYALLDLKLTLAFGFILMGLYFIGRLFPVPLCFAVFLLGWVLQTIGHYIYEKKSPAFFKSWIHLWIGPLWIFAKIIRYKEDPV